MFQASFVDTLSVRSKRIENFHSEITLPLVESVCSSFKNSSLTNICIIGAQHLLPTTLRMLVSLFERELNPKDVFLIGKCYSTDPHTYYKMIQFGMNVSESSCVFDKNEPFDIAYKKNISSFLRKIIPSILHKNYQKIIILDDGGELLTQIAFLLKDKRSNILGIEQTSSGFEKIKKQEFNFPIINVARSETKLKYESPLIGDAIAQQVSMKIGKNESKKNKILIIGKGAVGAAIFNALQGKFKVETFDLLAARSSLLSNDIKKSFNKFDFIIGSTGKSILKPEDFVFLKKGTCLMSASSSDREFSASELRKKYPFALSCHEDFIFNNIKVVNCGFPVNFSGDVAFTDPESFQLTRALLVAAILMGVKEKIPTNGLVPLQEKIQRKISSSYLRILRQKKLVHHRLFLNQ